MFRTQICRKIVNDLGQHFIDSPKSITNTEGNIRSKFHGSSELSKEKVNTNLSIKGLPSHINKPQTYGAKRYFKFKGEAVVYNALKMLRGNIISSLLGIDS
ncbi:hypothetical protein GWI33_013959 [Rhynchophorus ferrugineus]|uniref:Uncharacterized protein n=1 Tax=Rhynchophorus ferrugineus TaxID=354439 RepID=A0A834I3K4_RHYFE|nr:hypothetical protein GWI33_013959 [Rhynchophorus ferrugineus]